MTASASVHSRLGFSTKAIHVGSEPENSMSSAVTPAIELSTTYSQGTIGGTKFEYSRSANPTRLALERQLAALEGLDEHHSAGEDGPAALALASGSAATATVIQAITGNGGHIVSVGDVYGGTSRFMTKVASTLSGVATTFVDMSYSSASSKAVEGESDEQRSAREDQTIIDRVEAAITPETKIIWAETPTNPMLSLVPIRLLASIAQRRSIPLVIDNTFSSTYLTQPLLLGATVVVGSSTKYNGGFSDVIGGYIVTTVPSLLSKFRFLQNAHGAVPSPFDCWLLIRSLKTLALRVRQHSLNGLAVARWLQETAVPAGLVRDVNYPGLNRGAAETRSQKRERELAWSHLSPHAKKYFQSQGFSVDSPGGFPSGGMVSFHIKSPIEDKSKLQEADATQTSERFLEGLELFALAESLGGVESLAELPLKMTHAGVDPAHRALLGIDAELVRLSVGVEDVEDLLADLEQSLRAAIPSKQ
ncbi:trans-sulfuration enzyme family protein [Sporobolomyces koalae]|uniref:trans-sulfuration enzyme family protein n=1 Tax=Sporobolomyces koalae TaxID=500713 RepID=UPI0031770F1E